jgi:hypothetical protein
MHALVLVGLTGLARSGAAGTGRAARIGITTALIGTAVLPIAEFASIPIAGQRAGETGAMLVGGLFGIGNLIAAIGLITAGVATLRARRWSGWRRFSPLATGLILTVVLGLALTPALAAGVGVYGLGVLAMGLAVATQPAPSGAPPGPERAPAGVYMAEVMQPEEFSDRTKP